MGLQYNADNKRPPPERDHMVLLDQPWQIELFRLLQMKYMLRLEIKTGMRHSRGSILKVTNDTLIRNGAIERPCRTKVQALNALNDYIDKKERQAMGNG